MVKTNRDPNWLQAAMILASLQLASMTAEALDELDCVIEPHMVIDLSSRVDGIVDSIAVDRGQFIDKDQVLIKLEAGVERAVVAERRARAEAMAEVLAGQTSVAFAARRNGRIQELHRSQAVSTDQLDEINTEKELSRLQLQRARENQEIAVLELRQALEVLERHTLRSPINGVVVQRYLAPGESVEDQPIMRIAQIDPLRVEVIVPVTAFGSIKVGQPAIVRPEPPMAGRFPATVSVVDGVADAASGTFRVRLTLPNDDYSLASGLKCRVAFQPMRETPETQIAAVNPAPTPAQAGPKICRTIGPIKDAPAAEQIMKAIAMLAMKIELREEVEGVAESYVILTARQASKKDVVALTEKMLAEGIRDFDTIKRGPNKGRVALGVYSKRAFAQRRVAWLADRGFEAELVPRGNRRSRFWLDVELLPRVTALGLALPTKLVNGVDLTSTPCDGLVAQKSDATGN
jgi:RND family efflux transporter MFP subunit